MNDFDDIRPYNDSEVPAALARLIADPELMDVLLSRQFPLLTKVVPDLFNFLARPFLSRSLLKLTRGVSTVSDFQEHMTKRLREVLDRTTDNYQFSGLDNLDSDRALSIYEQS